MRQLKIAWVYTKGRTASWLKRALGGAPLGGSGTSMLHYAREFAKLGHEVTIFTPGVRTCEIDGVQWRDTKGMCQQQHDVAIALRFPEALPGMFARLRVLYCCDVRIPELPEYVNDGFVDLIITISKYQKDLFQEQYPIPTDLYMVSNAGIVYSDYLNKNVKKVKGRCIYCSTPVRGLLPLIEAWPLIREKVPYATLHVTGGLGLWGMDVPIEDQPMIQSLLKLEGAKYLGLLSREDLVREQLEAEVMLLPGMTNSREMCCISAMECQAAKVFPLVGDIGALPERVVYGNVGLVCPVDGLSVVTETFAELAIGILRMRDPLMDVHHGSEMARQYDYSVLAQQWIERFEKELERGAT